jgi:hypothetical protein
MSYLFGDSTPSPFRINFIEFLKFAMGFSVHVLRVERRVLEEQTKRLLLEEEHATDRQHLERLLGRVGRTIADASGDVQPRVAEYAELVHAKAHEVVEAGLQSLQQDLSKDLSAIEETIGVERMSARAALEKLLLLYDLPDATLTTHLRLAQGGKYSAWIEAATPYGVQTTMELVVGPESAFAHDAKVERFAENFEIRAPETGGWIRKGSRVVPQKLGRFHVTEVTLGEVCSIKLRSSTEANASGFDITIRKEEPTVLVSKTGKDEAGTEFALDPVDMPNVARLRESLEEALRLLSTKRKALTSALFDEEPIEESTRLRAFVERLVAVTAPMAREIAAHSFSSGELVLRRLIGDDRREEIFVSKAELRALLEGLSDMDRELFAPLELEQSLPAIPPILAARLSQAPAHRSAQDLGSDHPEERAPASGVTRSNRPPPMRTGFGG